MYLSRTWLAAILVAAFGAHTASFAVYAPGDVFGFVVPWFRELLANGFAKPIGNYAPPYLYLLWATTLLDPFVNVVLLIKLLSVAGLCWTAFAVSRVLAALGAKRELALLTFALPSLVADVSLLGQADTFWLAPCLLATAAAIEGRHARVAAWAGLAFAVKAQAAFLAPFVFYLFVHQRVPLRTWLIAPAVFAAAWLPAWVMGWPLQYLATLYFGQFDWVNNAGDYFIGSGASPWVAFGYLFPEATFNARWIGTPLVLTGLALYWRKMPAPTPERIVPVAAIGAALVPFLLPLMLDRFFLLADVLAVTYALARPSRTTIAAAACMQVASAMPIWAWAFWGQPLEAFASIFALAALVLLLRASRLHDDNGLIVARARRRIGEVRGNGPGAAQGATV